MKNNMATFLAKYASLLKAPPKVIEVPRSNCIVILFPILGLAKAFLEVYIHKDKEKIYLSDYGQTFLNLGFPAGRLSKNQQEIVQPFLSRYGIFCSRSELFSEATDADFPEQIYHLLMCMATLNQKGNLLKNL